MFYLVNFIDFCEHKLILSLMPATGYKQVGTGATNDWKSVEKTPVWNNPQVNRFISDRW